MVDFKDGIVWVDPINAYFFVRHGEEGDWTEPENDDIQWQKWGLKCIRLPYDIGRLPSNIFDNDSFSGVTAAQWKTYISTCARPCLYDLIPDRAYRCLVLLSEIVILVSSPVIRVDDITKLRCLLEDHHKLFNRLYGKWSSSVNYHMALHIPEMICDFGPPNAFWCFAYERLNGVLAGTPNSNRNVEVEVANRFFRFFF